MAQNPAPLLNLTEVRFGFPTRPDFLGPVSLQVHRGRCWAVVGPNGAGKSTLLRVMAGLHRPHAGAVELDGRPLPELSLRARAQRAAFVPQHPPHDLDLRVLDVVLMGRFPHRALGMFESAEDFRVAQRAMEVTETSPFADRHMRTLSGGEAQRVHIAAALAQEPQLLLLDEPTTSLDLHHQLRIFRILRDRALADGLGVVVVTHDVNLAGLFCSDVLLLDDGKVCAAGPPEFVLDAARLEPVYGVKLSRVALPDRPGRQWLVPLEAAGR